MWGRGWAGGGGGGTGSGDGVRGAAVKVGAQVRVGTGGGALIGAGLGTRLGAQKNMTEHAPFGAHGCAPCKHPYASRLRTCAACWGLILSGNTISNLMIRFPCSEGTLCFGMPSSFKII